MTIDDKSLSELIDKAKRNPQSLQEEREYYGAITALEEVAVELAEEVKGLRSMLNHAFACEVRNPAECNKCKDIWLKGYPYAE